MYSIGHVIYGVPLTLEISNKIDELEEDVTSDKWFEDNEGACGFTTFYHGGWNGHTGYCGVQLFKFDDAGILDLSKNKFKITPTDKQKKEAKKRIEQLMPELKELISKIGPYIVWSSS